MAAAHGRVNLLRRNEDDRARESGALHRTPNHREMAHVNVGRAHHLHENLERADEVLLLHRKTPGGVGHAATAPPLRQRGGRARSLLESEHHGRHGMHHFHADRAHESPRPSDAHHCERKNDDAVAEDLHRRNDCRHLVVAASNA